MKKILISGYDNKIFPQNQYYLINNYLKNYYNKTNVHIIEHLSSEKNYKTNFDKKVLKYGNYLSSFYFELINYYSEDKLKVETCKNYITYYAEALVRVSLSRLYKLYYSKKIKRIEFIELHEIENFNHEFQDTIEFQSFYQSYLYDNLRFSDYINQKIIDYNLVKLNKIIIQNDFHSKKNIKTQTNTESFFKKILRNFLSLLKRDNITVVHLPFINIFNNIKLQLLLGQIPWIPKENKPSFIQKNTSFIENLKKNLLFKEKNPIKRFLADIFVEMMPTCYLENIDKIKKLSIEIFPNNPKLIYTANAFAGDEVFKYWVSTKTDKLIIGQHGCNYCTTKYKINPSIEERISNRFITWGMKNYNTHHPGINFLDNKIVNFNSKNNKISLILYSQKGEYFFDEFFDFIAYQDFYKKFLKKFLNEYQKFEIIIKPHNTHQFNLINEESFWKKNFSNVKFVTDNVSLEQIVNTSYLTIFSYDSTDFFKSLHRKKNIILLSHNNLEHLREDVIQNYDLLRDKIIFTDTDKVIKFLSNHLTNLNSYFDREDIRLAKETFNGKLNVNSKKKIYDLSKCIKYTQNKI